MLGSIDTHFKDNTDQSYRILQASKPDDIIYDCTHDNPSVLDKFNTGKVALPQIGLNCVADKAIASTWGFDLLVPKQIHCVTEKRVYRGFDQTAILKEFEPAQEGQLTE